MDGAPASEVTTTTDFLTEVTAVLESMVATDVACKSCVVPALTPATIVFSLPEEIDVVGSNLGTET